MLNDILAKSANKFNNNPAESLVIHTKNIIEVWEQLKTRYKEKLNLSDNFWEDSFLSVLFHDFGKVTDNFQLVIKDLKKYDDNYIRHEFFSGILLYLYQTQKQNPLNLLAVFSHHKPLSDDLFGDQDSKAIITVDNANFIALVDWFDNELEKKKLPKLSEKVTNEKIFKLFEINQGFNKMFICFKGFFDFFRSSDLDKGIRKQYIFYKALLNIADWTASGHNNLPNGLVFQQDYLKSRIIEKLKEEGKTKIANEFNFREFQNKSIKLGSVLAIAPTGSGKTEAALLWATQKQEFEKIIYLLPTRVTSNAIYKRLVSYFGEDNCAVVHSSAFLFRKTLDDNFHKGKYLKDKTFFSNVNICTIDQILTQGFNLGFWEIKTFHLLNAKIIIDEVHLYAPYTLGLIIATIKYLKQDFGVQFFIMTATMPKKLQELLQNTLEISDENIVKDTELLQKARNAFEVREMLVDGLDTEIKEAIAEKKKVLIVVNTVDEAIRLYEKYKNECKNVLCFHSRFIVKDRLEKEQKILALEKQNIPLLLIATQVVEVSLDIDFDILFTENAPIDAIIQRAGRINRKREKEDTRIIVFQHQQKTEDYVYTREDFLVKTFEILKQYHKQKLTEETLLQLVDKVYENYDVLKDESYIKGLEAYKKVQRESLHYIKDNLGLEETYTREDLDSENVVPSRFQEELLDKTIEEKSQYEVSISKKKIRGNTIPDAEHKWIKYFDCDYNSETGLKFKKKSI